MWKHWNLEMYLDDGYRELPRSLTAQDWMCRESHVIQRVLGSLRVWPTQVCTAYVSEDETGIRHWYSGSKQESMQWRVSHASSPPPRKIKPQPSTGKMMVTIFSDSKCVLLIDYLPDKTTMNGQYYVNFLFKLRQAIEDKRRGMLMHGDNSPVHKLRIAQ